MEDHHHHLHNHNKNHDFESHPSPHHHNHSHHSNSSPPINILDTPPKIPYKHKKQTNLKKFYNANFMQSINLNQVSFNQYQQQVEMSKIQEKYAGRQPNSFSNKKRSKQQQRLENQYFSSQKNHTNSTSNYANVEILDPKTSHVQNFENRQNLQNSTPIRQITAHLSVQTPVNIEHSSIHSNFTPHQTNAHKTTTKNIKNRPLFAENNNNLPSTLKRTSYRKQKKSISKQIPVGCTKNLANNSNFACFPSDRFSEDATKSEPIHCIPQSFKFNYDFVSEPKEVISSSSCLSEISSSSKDITNITDDSEIKVCLPICANYPITMPKLPEINVVPKNTPRDDPEGKIFRQSPENSSRFVVSDSVVPTSTNLVKTTKCLGDSLATLLKSLQSETKESNHLVIKSRSNTFNFRNFDSRPEIKISSLVANQEQQRQHAQNVNSQNAQNSNLSQLKITTLNQELDQTNQNVPTVEFKNQSSQKQPSQEISLFSQLELDLKNLQPRIENPKGRICKTFTNSINSSSNNQSNTIDLNNHTCNNENNSENTCHKTVLNINKSESCSLKSGMMIPEYNKSKSNLSFEHDSGIYW